MNPLLIFSEPLLFVAWLASILLALTVHEFSHALAATLMGDPTAKRMGRLTLNPLAHIDIFGLIAMVLVHFGWGKPVPFNPYQLRYRKWGSFLVGLAGPVSNFVMLAVYAVLLKVLAPSLGLGNFLVLFLAFSFLINAGLMLFNLLPFPPLDGSKLVLALLHAPKWSWARMAVEYYGQWILLGLLVMDLALGFGILSMFLDPLLNYLIDLFGVHDVLSQLFGGL